MIRYSNALNFAGRPGTGRTAMLGSLLVALLVVPIFLVLLLTVDAETLVLFITTFGLGVPAVWLVWRRPELGLLALVFVASSFIPLNTINLRLPVGGLNLRDLVFIAALVLFAARVSVTERLVIPWWPVSSPLLVLVGMATFSAAFALFYKGVDATWALGELRAFLYYGVMFACAWAIRRRRQLVVLLVGLFIVSDLVCAFLVLQQLFGTNHPLLAAMANGGWLVWQADDPTLGFGVVRVIPPAHVLIYIVSVLALCLMLYSRQPKYLRILLLLQYVYINVALLFTYTRAQWLASLIALVLCFSLLPVTDKLTFVRYAAGAALFAALVFAIWGDSLQGIANKAPFLNSLTNRAATILTPDETLASYSLEWRVFETDAALHSISEHPWLGVGLGNVYRDVTLLFGEAQRTFRGPTDRGYLRLARFVHNGYLFMAVKAGIPTLIVFAVLALSFVAHSWRTYTKAQDGQLKRIALGVMVSFIGVLAWSVTEPQILKIESTTAIGLMMGVVASIARMENLQ